MDKRKILVVEDEKITREGIRAFLESKGFFIIEARDGEEAINVLLLKDKKEVVNTSLLKNKKIDQNEIDLVILDVMLPKKNGIEVLKKIREKSQVPILMLTALTDEGTQVVSFDNRADDYLSKPFSLLILLKRIEALLRRSQSEVELCEENDLKIWKFGEVEVDFLKYKGYKRGIDVDLKPKEVELLRLLLRNSKRVMSREQILSELWKDEQPYDRVIDVYVKNLRKKMGINCIETVKGVGYRINIEKEKNENKAKK